MTADWFLSALRHDRASLLRRPRARRGPRLGVAARLPPGNRLKKCDMGGARCMLACCPEWSLGYGLGLLAIGAVMKGRDDACRAPQP